MKLEVKRFLNDDFEIDSKIIKSMFEGLLGIYKIKAKIDQNTFDKFLKKIVLAHNKEVKSEQKELKRRRR